MAPLLDEEGVGGGRGGPERRLRLRSGSSKAILLFDPELFNETHAPHVRREAIDFLRVFARLDGVFFCAHIQAETLHAGYAMVLLWQGLFIHGTDLRDALIAEVPNKCPADESACAGDDDLSFFDSGTVRKAPSFLFMYPPYVYFLILAISSVTFHRNLEPPIK